MKYSSEDGIRYVEMTEVEFDGLEDLDSLHMPRAPSEGEKSPVWKSKDGVSWEMHYYVDYSPGGGQWGFESRAIRIDEDWKGRALKAEAEVKRLSRGSRLSCER